MKYHDISNPKWANADHTMIECTVVFELEPAVPARPAVPAVPAVAAIIDPVTGLVLQPARPAIAAIPATPAVDAVYSDPWPFGAHLDDVEPHGAEIFNAASAMGPAAYVAPPPIVPAEISRLQFIMQARNQSFVSQAEAQAFLATGAVPASLNSIISALPTQQQINDATLKIVGATTFLRSNVITIELGTAFAAVAGASDATAFMDAFFIAAAGL